MKRVLIATCAAFLLSALAAHAVMPNGWCPTPDGDSTDPLSCGSLGVTDPYGGGIAGPGSGTTPATQCVICAANIGGSNGCFLTPNAANAACTVDQYGYCRPVGTCQPGR